MKENKHFSVLYVFLLMTGVLPLISYAVTTPTDFKSLVMLFVEILTAILPLIVTLAFFYFIWGLTQYMRDAGGNKEDARMMMIHGIIGFFVMSSVWGLVGILSNTFGTESQKPSTVNDIYYSGGGVGYELQEDTNVFKDLIKNVSSWFGNAVELKENENSIKEETEADSSLIKTWVKNFTALFTSSAVGDPVDSDGNWTDFYSTGVHPEDSFDRDTSSYFDIKDIDNPYYNGDSTESNSSGNYYNPDEAAEEKKGGSFLFYILPWNWF